MRLGARGAWAALLLGALQVPALLVIAEENSHPAVSTGKTKAVLLQNSNINSTGNIPPTSSNNTSKSSSSTLKPTTTTVSSTSSNMTALKSTATSKMSTNTSTTIKPSPKMTSVSQSTAKIPTSTMTTTHNSSVTSVSSSVTLTATVNAKESKGSKFDIGSFVGGIALTLGVLSILYVGCKTYYSRRGIRYRTIDEHDAII